MNRAVASDASAIAGVKRLLAEIDATRPIGPKVHVQSELQAAAAMVAARLSYPSDPDRQDPRQHEIFQHLDAVVRQHDPELWRLKQISDLCSGIWAQTFGRDYTMLISPVLTARTIARFAGPVALLGLVCISQNRRRPRARVETSPG
jgi:hypothetical protein